MIRFRPGTLYASCTAMLVTNLPAWPVSPPPREKKKLAPRLSFSEYLEATVRAIVDLPVPAKPLNQKMLGVVFLSAQSYISRRRSTRVLGRQVGSCCRWYALKGASLAIGKELSTSFRSGRTVVSAGSLRQTVTAYLEGDGGGTGH